jgi:hypothetical protein
MAKIYDLLNSEPGKQGRKQANAFYLIRSSLQSNDYLIDYKRFDALFILNVTVYFSSKLVDSFGVLNEIYLND